MGRPSSSASGRAAQQVCRCCPSRRAQRSISGATRGHGLKRERAELRKPPQLRRRLLAVEGATCPLTLAHMTFIGAHWQSSSRWVRSNRNGLPSQAAFAFHAGSSYGRRFCGDEGGEDAAARGSASSAVGGWIRCGGGGVGRRRDRWRQRRGCLGAHGGPEGWCLPGGLGDKLQFQRRLRPDR